MRKPRFASAQACFAAGFAVTLLILFIAAAHAQIMQLAPSTRTIQDIRDHARQWRTSADVQVCLFMAVGVFGAAISALHRLNSTWAKNCVLVFGVLSTVFTGIDNSSQNVFSADYRSLRRAANEADLVVLQMEQIANTPNLAALGADDRLVVYKAWNQQVNAYTGIVRSIEGASENPPLAKAGGFILLNLPAVEAQSTPEPPKWISNPPSSATNLYFVGVGSDTFLAKAEDRSLADGREQIARAFALRPPYAPSETGINLVQSAVIQQSTYYRYDKNASAYTFFTLLSIARNLRDVLSPTAEFRKQDWFPVDLAFDPVAGLFVLDRNGGVGQLTYTTNGIQMQPLFHLPNLPAGDQATAITARQDAVYVSTASETRCTVYEYSLTSKALKPTFVGSSKCDGIATDGAGIYLALPGAEDVRYWAHWGDRSYQSLGVPDTGGASRYSVLHYDAVERRLLWAGTSGNSYQFSTVSRKWSYLDGNVGYVHAVDCDWNSVLFASGKKVLFYDRQRNQGVNPVPTLTQPSKGTIYGLAVDTSDAVWIADHDNSTIRGPFRLN